MKPDFLRKFDGLERSPRHVQTQALTWLSDNWSKYEVFGMNLPVASGKSAIARAIQLATGFNIVVPSNTLMDQYKETYDSINTCKGIDNFQCTSMGGFGKCSTRIKSQKLKPCFDCPYALSKERALMGDNTVWNVSSLYYGKKHPNYVERPGVIVDESHLIHQLLLQFCDTTFPKKIYKYPKNITSEFILTAWLAQQIERELEKADIAESVNNIPKSVTHKKRADKIELIREGLLEAPQDYAVFESRETGYDVLHLRPLLIPSRLTQALLGTGKTILLSGSILESDVKAIAGARPYTFLELDSPIPVPNRVIYSIPAPVEIKWDTENKDIAEAIDTVIDLYPDQNILIHTTYSRSKGIYSHSRYKDKMLINDKNNKNQILEQFKSEGGIFLASGCSEGIDLKDDLCRVCIVFDMGFPNMMDTWTSKRMAMQDGQEWFQNEALKLMIQRFGRGVRNEKDYCVNVMINPKFDGFINRIFDRIPKSFKESLNFGGQLPNIEKVNNND